MIERAEAVVPDFAVNVEVEKQPRRLRLRFSKTASLRFLSHLELINLFTRAVQRAGVPILYSNGFHPHPRFSFATATSVGISSQAEYLDLFVDAMGAEEALDRLNRVLPEGMRILEAVEVPLKTDALATQIMATRYRIVLPDYDPTLLQQQCVQFMAHDSWVLTRDKQGKLQTFDLRAEVKELASHGSEIILLIGRGKALEVASAVTGLDAGQLSSAKITKTDLVFVAY